MLMTRPGQIIMFALDQQRYGIPLDLVERVVRMVEITQLPTSPGLIHGVINVQGKILPVLDLRQRLGLPRRRVELSDQLIIMRSSAHSFALMTETACQVRECTEQMVADTAKILPDLPFLSGVVKFPDGLILLQDPELLFSTCETKALDELLAQEPS